MMTARSVVSVSELAAEVMRRDFHIQPEIIRNGVNFSDIKQGGEKDGYILWPKMDVNPTCDPRPFLKLATLRHDLRLASIVNLGGEIKSFGRMPRKVFLSLLQDCAIYLGVTRENCSMGTMEAMACFVEDTNITASGIIKGMSRNYSGTLITITIKGKKIQVTPEHPFWTNNGWVLAKRLTIKHQLCYNSKYGTSKKIHTGTIREVVESIQKFTQ